MSESTRCRPATRSVRPPWCGRPRGHRWQPGRAAYARGEGGACLPGQVGELSSGYRMARRHRCAGTCGSRCWTQAIRPAQRQGMPVVVITVTSLPAGSMQLATVNLQLPSRHRGLSPAQRSGGRAGFRAWAAARSAPCAGWSRRGTPGRGRRSRGHRTGPRRRCGIPAAPMTSLIVVLPRRWTPDPPRLPLHVTTIRAAKPSSLAASRPLVPQH